MEQTNITNQTIKKGGSTRHRSIVKLESKTEYTLTIEDCSIIARVFDHSHIVTISTTDINGKKKMVKRFNSVPIAFTANTRKLWSTMENFFMEFLPETHLAAEKAVKAERAEMSKVVFAAHSKRILENERISFYNVVVGEKKTTVYASLFPMSRPFREAEIAKDLVMRTRGGSWKTFNGEKDKATKDYVMLHVDDLKMVNKLMTDGIYLVYAGTETAVYIPEKKGFRSLTNGSYAATLEGLGDVRYYRGFSYSPSNIRTVQVLFKDITNGDNRETFMDSISNGAWSVIKWKRMSVVELIKTGPRFGQFNAGSINFGRLPGWVEYKGNFSNPDENGADSMDGSAIYWDEFIAQLISEFRRIYVTAETVRGLFFQSRPATMKIAALARSKRAMLNIIANLDPEMVIYHGDRNNICAIVDQNGIKAGFNMDSDIDLEILDFARPSKARLSKQTIEKLLSADKESTIALLDDLFDTQVASKLVKSLIKREPEVPTIEDLDKGYIVDLVNKIAPRYLEKDRAFFTSTTRTLVQSITKMIDKMSFETEGANLRLVPDMSFLTCGKNVLQYGEGFSPAANREKRRHGMMVKYPAMGLSEFYLAKFLTMGDIRRRLKTMDLTQDQYDDIMEFFSTMSDGVFVVPAREVIKAQCAGLDFDFDGCTMYWDERIIAIAMKASREAVYIMANAVSNSAKLVNSLQEKLREVMDSDDKNKKLPNCDAFMEGWIAQVCNGNLSIGVITFMNSMIIAILQLPESEFMTMGKQALIDSVEGAGFGTSIYEGLSVEDFKVDGVLLQKVEVSQAISKIIKAEIATADLNNYANLKKIYTDLNRLYRMYQELTIDAAKKGTKVEIDIMITTVWANSLSKMTHDFSSFEEPMTVKRVERKFSKKNPRTAFDDTIATLQNEYARKFNEVFNKDIKDAYEMVGFNSAELALFESFSRSHQGLVDDLSKVIKYAYGTLAMDYAAARHNEENGMTEQNEDYDNDTQDTDSVEELKKDFDDAVEILSNTVKQMLTGIDLADAGRMLKLAAMTTAGGVDAKSTNQMALNLYEEAFLAMILEDYADIKVAGYPLLAGHEGLVEGDILDFVDGGCGKTLIKAAFTGELEIQNIDGKLYAVKPIEVLGAAPDTSRIAFVVRKAIDIRSTDGTEGDYNVLSHMLNSDKRVNLTLNKEAEGYGKTIRDAVTFAFVGKSGKEMTRIAARYRTESSVLTNLYDGVTGNIGQVILKSVFTQQNRKRTDLIVELANVVRTKAVEAYVPENLEPDFEEAGF